MGGGGLGEDIVEIDAGAQHPFPFIQANGKRDLLGNGSGRRFFPQIGMEPSALLGLFDQIVDHPIAIGVGQVQPVLAGAVCLPGVNDIYAVIVVNEKVSVLAVIERVEDGLDLGLCRFIVRLRVVINAIDCRQCHVGQVKQLVLFGLDHIALERINARARQAGRLPCHQPGYGNDGKDQRNDGERQNLVPELHWVKLSSNRIVGRSRAIVADSARVHYHLLRKTG